VRCESRNGNAAFIRTHRIDRRLTLRMGRSCGFGGSLPLIERTDRTLIDRSTDRSARSFPHLARTLDRFSTQQPRISMTSASSSSSSSYASSSTSTSASSCQAYADAVAVAWHSTVAALSATYTILIYLSYAAGRLKDKWANSPNVAAAFWFVAVLPKLCAALALFTVLLPACTADCPCDNTGPLYAYPSISLFLCAVWVARGFALLRRARREATNGTGVVRAAGPSSSSMAGKEEEEDAILRAHASAPGGDGKTHVPSTTEMV
jgi:hypothetical protein